MEQHNHLVPRESTLEGFVEELTRRGGLDVTTLEPLTRFYVRTVNTQYVLTTLEPSASRVLIEGGKLFGEPTPAVVFGSSYGGGFLKKDWIGIGMRMELYAGDRRIVTSPVRSISVEEAPPAGPF